MFDGNECHIADQHKSGEQEREAERAGILDRVRKARDDIRDHTARAKNNIPRIPIQETTPVNAQAARANRAEHE